MRITEIEIKDIGKISHLKKTIDTPMVGLIGPNGSGKSTVLGFIGFLFTGIAPGDPPQPQETFVRYWGSENGAANGWGRVKFIQHGQEGEIFRQVGKTPKRSLRWGAGPSGDGKPYTKAKDIEDVLSEILGSNRRAMVSSIFIPQGNLDKLFFGGEAEREEMFIKMIQLSYLEKVEKVVIDRQSIVAAGLQDLSVLSDEIAVQRNAAEEALANLEIELRRFRDRRGDIQILKAYQRHLETADNEIQAIDRYKAELQTARASLAQFLESSAPELSGLDDQSLDNLVGDAQNQIQQLERAKLDQAKRQDFVARWEEIRRRISVETANKNSRESRRKDLLPKTSKSEMDLSHILAVIGEREAATRSRVEAQQKIIELKNNLEQLSVSPVEQELEKDLTQKLESANKAFRDAEVKFQVLEKTVSNMTETCPVCDRHMDASMVTEEKVSQAKSAAEDRRQEMEVIRTKLDTARSAILQKNEQRIQLAQSMVMWTSVVEKSQPSTEYLDANKDDIMAELTQLRQDKKELAEIDGQLSQINQALSEMLVEFHNIPEKDLVEAKSALANPDIQAMLTNADSQIAAFSRKIQAVREHAQVFRQGEKRIAEIQARIGESENRRAKALQEIDAMQASLTAEMRTELSTPEAPNDISTDSPLASFIRRLEDQVRQRNELAGKVSQARLQADAVRNKQNALQERIDRDAGRRELIRELQILRDTFTKNGLPLRYARYQFDRLVNITRQGLAELDAGFTVSADPVKSMSFNFTLLDEEDPYTMPQSKLSGGQKVRLSLAFLLAVQKVLTPEISFLVLDEPSLHLDAEGKENLRELFVSLSHRLGNSESQIWACDHDPMLETAFGSVIKTDQFVD